MKQQLLMKTIALTAFLMAQAGEVIAQGTETYDFGSWTKKEAKNQTLNLESSVTSSTGKTVYKLENFLDKDGTTNHNLNNRFAFEKSDDAHPYGWGKFEGYASASTVAEDLMTAGMHLKNKNKTISILNLKAGDVITIWHNFTMTESSTDDGIYVTSKNASYVSASGATKISSGSTKTAGNALVSGTAYTMISDGTFDFTSTSSEDFYLRKVTIQTVGTNGIRIGSTGYATFSCETSVSFAGTGVQAFWASSQNEGNVTFTEIEDGQIPANVGVLLKATPGNYTYSAGLSSVSYTTNLLKNIKDNLSKVKAPETKDSKTTTNYLLAHKDGIVGFYKVTDQKTGLGGKAYLSLVTDAVSTARESLNILFDDETTGIRGIENLALDPWNYYTKGAQESEIGNSVYNLNGQRVNVPKKGLYIVNGKKVIKK